MNTNYLFALRRFTRSLATLPIGEVWLRLAYRILPRPSEPVLLDDFDGDLKIRLSLSEHMQSVIFWKGNYSRDLALLLDHILMPNMTVIDVGANIGEITLLAAKRVGANGRVVAFEPIEDIAERLNENVNANAFRNVIINRTALCDTEGFSEIYRSSKKIRDGSINDGLGSLYLGRRGKIAAGLIPVSTLDAQVAGLGLTQVDVIKIDVEGAELPALRGASEVLRTHRPILIVEVQEETATAAGYGVSDLFNFLHAHGYRLETILDNGCTEPLDPSKLKHFQNMLCIPIEA